MHIEEGNVVNQGHVVAREQEAAAAAAVVVYSQVI